MEEITILNLPITITECNNKPQITLKKKVSDKELIKLLCQCAYRNIPIQIQPTFTNKLLSLSQMQSKKIIEYDKEKDVYNFLI